MNLFEIAFILAILSLVVLVAIATKALPILISRLRNDNGEIEKLEQQVKDFEYLRSLPHAMRNPMVSAKPPDPPLPDESFDKLKAILDRLDAQEKPLTELRGRRDNIWESLFPYLEEKLKEENIVIVLGEDKIYFDTGKAVPRAQNPITGELLTDALSEIFDKVIEMIDKRNINVIQVEAHTDIVPIHNEEFESNWELSVHRALYLAKRIDWHLQQNGYKRIEQYIVIAAGYGEHLPNTGHLKEYFENKGALHEDVKQFSNKTTEGKQKNRRLVVTFFRRKFVTTKL
jgi:flagellar motor protein MotB